MNVTRLPVIPYRKRPQRAQLSSAFPEYKLHGTTACLAKGSEVAPDINSVVPHLKVGRGPLARDCLALVLPVRSEPCNPAAPLRVEPAGSGAPSSAVSRQVVRYLRWVRQKPLNQDCQSPAGVHALLLHALLRAVVLRPRTSLALPHDLPPQPSWPNQRQFPCWV